ncbi:MAG: glycosyltransferase family 1 protein [candidate division WOR-3 bacterium]
MRIGIDVKVLREEKRGVGYYLVNLLEQFARLDAEDTFFLYAPKPVQLNQSENNRWHYRFGNSNLPGFFWINTFGKHFINRDDLQVFFEPFNLLPQGLPHRIKKVVAVHDFLAVHPNMLSYYGRLLHKVYFRRSLNIAHHIITMSGIIKQQLVNHFSINSSKITVIYEGVSQIFHPYSKDEILKFRQEFNLLKPYLLTVATLEPCKNYPTLIKAFAQLKQDLDLVIIGKKGWRYYEIFSLIRELKLNERVKVMGYVPQDKLPFFYNGAEIYIHPSWYEGFGLPVLEAMASGTPIIASNSSSLPEVGGEAALYFNPASIEELVFKINMLLSNDELKNDLKKKGIERAQQFTWEKTALETLKILKDE